MESRKQKQSKVPKHGGSNVHYSQDGSATESASSTTEANPKASPTARQTPPSTTTSSPAARDPSCCRRSREGFGGCLHSAYRRTLRGVVVRGDPDHRLPHHSQLAAYREPPGTRSSVELSPCLFQALLVAVASRPRLGRVHPDALGAQWDRGLGRRRYGGGTSRQEGLRQRMSSRRRPLDPLVHGLPLGTQVGGAGDSGEVPLCDAAVGI